MKKSICSLMLMFGLFITSTFAQEDVMNVNNLKKIDASWEKAQLELDYNYIDSLLAKDFIWVHNHANTIDDKTAVLNRIQRYIDGENHTVARDSKNVEVIVSGTTAIVSGNAIITKGTTTITYHFMRTYVKVDGKCYLLANHTMAIPDKKE